MAFQRQGLSFREIEPSDLPMLRDFRNTQATGWRDNRGVQTMLQQEKWYCSLGPENLAFVVEAYIEGQGTVVVGMLRISRFDWLHKNVSLTGTDVFPEFQGKGYATRILKAAFEYCTMDLGFHRVTGECIEGNEGARLAIIRAGFTYEGKQRLAIWRDNQWNDFLQFSRLAGE